MQNLKIRVNSEAESREVQGLFFKLGGSWAGYKKIHDWPEIKQLYLGENYITFSNDINFFMKDSSKEITLAELRAMVHQDQDEPFLTPECALNDQYAEIEQVRQHKKHERNLSAWDVQVGGDHYKQFQIQPMQFALENKLDAAQQNVIKYIMRHSFKNGKQDLEKAKHYIDLMIEFYYGGNNNG